MQVRGVKEKRQLIVGLRAGWELRSGKVCLAENETLFPTGVLFIRNSVGFHPFDNKNVGYLMREDEK